MSRGSSATPVTELLAHSYRRFADRVAVSDGERSLTYGELQSRATAVARGLQALGCAPGDRVVIMSPNRCEWVEVDHAAYLGGFVRVSPLLRLHPHELLAILEDAEPSVVIVDGEWLSRSGFGWLPQHVEHIFTIETSVEGVRGLEDLVALGGGDGTVATTDPAAPSWIMFTSGSTGTPKGVVSSGETIGAMVRGILEEMPGLGPDDVALHTAPLSHFSGGVALAVFAVGGLNRLHGAFAVDDVIETLQSSGVSVLPLVPTQIGMLTDAIRDRTEVVNTSGLRAVVYAGSAITPDRLQRAQDVLGPVMLQFYGSSEALMPLTALQPHEHHSTPSAEGALPRLASAGRTHRFVELRIIDVQGADAARGEVGEIVVSGANVMSGYWRQPEATAEVIGADGWLHTGDLGYLDEDGFLFIVDRKKDMIVTGGLNVYPREVENAIATLEGVSEVAVVGAPSERWGEEITAVVAPAAGVDLDEGRVVAHCRRQIAGYKVPKRVHIVAELPKSGTGKILKRDIRDQFWGRRERKV